MGVTVVDVYFGWLNWFHLLILIAGALVILIGCMIFLPLFLDVLDVIRIFMSTVASMHS